jgi:hypothetical protein
MEYWEGCEFEFWCELTDDREEFFFVSEERGFDCINIRFLEIDFIFSGKIGFDKLSSLKFSATSGASIERLEEEFTGTTARVHKNEK